MSNLSTDNNIKMGIIGCGLITSELRFFSKFLKNVKIQAATDLILKRAVKIARKEHAYTDVEKMFMNEDLDAIYIATPHYPHKKYIEQAFIEGKHIWPYESSLEMQLFINKDKLDSLHVKQKGRFSFIVDLPEKHRKADTMTVTIKPNKTFVPFKHRINTDRRKLSFILENIKLF